MAVKNRYLIVIFLFILTGCSHNNIVVTPKNDYQRPSWIYLSPSQNGKIGGIGVSGKHIDGFTGQRELAISRALDEIAKQLGTTVTTMQNINTEGTKDNIKSEITSYSFQTTDGKVVKAIIKNIWYDNISDELYVWMLQE